MCDNCCKQNQENENNSSFIFGLIIGLIAAAVIAVVIYRYRKSDVVTALKAKLNDLTGGLFNSPPSDTKPTKKFKPHLAKAPKAVKVPIAPVPIKVVKPKPRVFKVNRK